MQRFAMDMLRSSFAMEFYKSEKNLLVLQERMGHKSMSALCFISISATIS